MFTRNSNAEPKTLEPINPASNMGLNMQQRRSGPAGSQEASGPKSVIGNDLKIIGQGLKIISQGTLQVDGEIEGDVRGSEVIIGEQGKVTGTVAAERVIVRGKIAGVIRGVTVALQSSSRVEGDIHHMSLAIEQGAEFDGRCKRPADHSELNLDLDSQSGGSPIPLPRAS
jgi:cytoskeletal protein CcmA (bactofilin family)